MRPSDSSANFSIHLFPFSPFFTRNLFKYTISSLYEHKNSLLLCLSFRPLCTSMCAVNPPQTRRRGTIVHRIVSPLLARQPQTNPYIPKLNGERIHRHSAAISRVDHCNVVSAQFIGRPHHQINRTASQELASWAHYPSASELRSPPVKRIKTAANARLMSINPPHNRACGFVCCVLCLGTDDGNFGACVPSE